MTEREKRLRAAIVGIGRHGFKQLAFMLSQPTRWEVVAISDRAPTAYARVQAQYADLRLPFVRRAAELLAFDPDVVMVSTTAQGHVPAALELIEAGYEGALLIEKPVATRVADARRLQAVVDNGWPGRAGVDFHRRCSSMYAEVFRTVASGELGAVLKIRYASAEPEKVSMEGSHRFDLATWLLGSRAVSVRATLDAYSSVDTRGSRHFDPAGSAVVTYEHGTHFNWVGQATPARTAPDGSSSANKAASSSMRRSRPSCPGLPEIAWFRRAGGRRSADGSTRRLSRSQGARLT